MLHPQGMLKTQSYYYPRLKGESGGSSYRNPEKEQCEKGSLLGALTFLRESQPVHCDPYSLPSLCSLQGRGGGGSDLTQTEAQGQGSGQPLLTVASQYSMVWPVPWSVPAVIAYHSVCSVTLTLGHWPFVLLKKKKYLMTLVEDGKAYFIRDHCTIHRDHCNENLQWEREVGLHSEYIMGKWEFIVKKQGEGSGLWMENY